MEILNILKSKWLKFRKKIQYETKLSNYKLLKLVFKTLWSKSYPNPWETVCFFENTQSKEKKASPERVAEVDLGKQRFANCFSNTLQDDMTRETKVYAKQAI